MFSVDKNEAALIQYRAESLGPCFLSFLATDIPLRKLEHSKVIDGKSRL